MSAAAGTSRSWLFTLREMTEALLSVEIVTGPEPPGDMLAGASTASSPAAASSSPGETRSLAGQMRVCLVYDRLYPQSIGGAERWLRDLALRLATLGHEVTYLTTDQWTPNPPPSVDGVHVIGLIPQGRVYEEGRRGLLPPLRFGFAVFRHLARHGRDYDVVHTESFPFFPLLAAAVLRPRFGFSVVVDWHEVWTRDYWRSYAGSVIGTMGWLVQRLCLKVPQRAFCDSRMHAERLRAEGLRGTADILPGLYAGPVGSVEPEALQPLVVYAGRHVREKRVTALVRAFALVSERRPELRLHLYGGGAEHGAGPERERVERLVAELDLHEVVSVLGVRSEQELSEAIASAACVATASEREGYGLLVVEAAARGTPSVVVAGPENAAVELVTEGVNGAVAASAEPHELAEAIMRVIDAGPALRASTLNWFSENLARLSIEASFAEVLASYGSASA
jgi:glycosyltransferase involved in cell wall biosynthesis